jgi:hypothetical protein
VHRPAQNAQSAVWYSSMKTCYAFVCAVPNQVPPRRIKDNRRIRFKQLDDGIGHTFVSLIPNEPTRLRATPRQWCCHTSPLRSILRYADTIVQLRGLLCSGQMTTVICRWVAIVNRATMFGSNPKLLRLSRATCPFAATNELQRADCHCGYHQRISETNKY